MLPGLSKGQFKSAVGALLREGAVTINSSIMALVPEALRQPLPASPYDGKSPQGFKVSPDGATLFVGNLDFGLDDVTLARAIEVCRVSCVVCHVSCATAALLHHSTGLPSPITRI